MCGPCPLCKTPKPSFFYHGPQRDYLRCRKCGLIFVPREELPLPAAEKARYDLHENDPTDQGYRRFLNQVIKPLLAHIGPPPQHGLDFGSGPGPVLAQMLTAQGYRMACFDPFYRPHPKALGQSYDFITCTEAMEHFHQPAKEWQILRRLLRPGGWLGIMTKLVDDLSQFSKMHYLSDLTHVSFYSRQTFNYLARQDGLRVKFYSDNVILIQKPIRA